LRRPRCACPAHFPLRTPTDRACLPPLPRGSRRWRHPPRLPGQAALKDRRAPIRPRQAVPAGAASTPAPRALALPPRPAPPGRRSPSHPSRQWGRSRSQEHHVIPVNHRRSRGISEYILVLSGTAPLQPFAFHIVVLDKSLSQSTAMLIL